MPQRLACQVISANKISTRLSQGLEVGVKCNSAASSEARPSRSARAGYRCTRRWPPNDTRPAHFVNDVYRAVKFWLAI